MKAAKVLLVILMVVLVSSVMGAFIYALISKEPIAQTSTGNARDINPIPYNSVEGIPSVSESENLIYVDFNECKPGSFSKALPLGSGHLVFQGKDGEHCVFYQGGEVENPRWDGLLHTYCRVPITVGKQAYSLGYSGIQFTDKQYCQEV